MSGTRAGGKWIASSVKKEDIKKLREAGYFVPAIRWPTVPHGAAMLRVTVMATHTDAQIDGLAHAISRL